MSSSSYSAIPIMFTLPPSNRHELILLDTSSKLSLKALNKHITATIASSPNCAEFMQKHKKPSEDGEPQDAIQEIRIHWAEAGRDRRIWPEYTVVTEENLGAVLEVLRLQAGSGGVRDVVEVKVGRGE